MDNIIFMDAYYLQKGSQSYYSDEPLAIFALATSASRGFGYYRA